MRILYLTSHFPCGPASGSQMRALHIGRALKELGNVDLIAVGAEEHSAATVEATRREFGVLGSLGVEVLRSLKGQNSLGVETFRSLGGGNKAGSGGKGAGGGGQWAVGGGQWAVGGRGGETVDGGQWTVDGRGGKTVDGGQWTVDGRGGKAEDGGQWAVGGRGGKTVDGGQRTVIGGQGAVDGGRWTVGGGAVGSGRFRALKARTPYPHGMMVPEADQRWVEALLPNYDLVWFFKLRTANFFGRWNWPNSVVDIDDVPSTYELSEMRRLSGIPKLKSAVRAFVWKRREQLLSERFNAVCVCSENDRRHLNLQIPVHVVPNGFSRPQLPPARNPVQPPRIGFIGLFDHIPNAEGVRWFIRECWPLVKAQVPGCRLRLAGKGSDTLDLPPGPDIDRLGWVADSQEEIATWSTMIVPIQLGAGTRVKIPDAFSRKCPVVSTTLGAYGYEVQHGTELLLADDPARFANGCVTLIQAPDLAAAMASRAYTAFLKNWTWEAIERLVQNAARSAERDQGAAAGLQTFTRKN